LRMPRLLQRPLLEGIAYKLVKRGVRASRALRLTYALLLPLTIFTTIIPWLYLVLTIPLEGLLEFFESSIPYFATLVFILNISKLLTA